MRTILTTVGTSLLKNACRDLGREHDLANYLRHTPPDKACAETNSLSRLLKEDDRIVFLCSDTDDGKRCAETLRSFYSNQGYQAEVVPVPNLNYTESRFKMRGLRSLVATMIKQIQNERKAGREVLINATGGFKAETAYATLVGLLFNVPVYYIHEVFRDIIEMPPIPINWDYSLIADYEEFFEWIDTDLRPTDEVERRLRSLPDRDKIHLLLIDEEGYTYLSPAGEVYYYAYRGILSQPGDEVLLSRKAQDTYQAADPSTRECFDKVLRNLSHAELRQNQSDLVRGSDCLVYPRGHRNERVIFYEQDGKVYVCELTRHSDQSYERVREERVQRANYSDFTPWNG